MTPSLCHRCGFRRDVISGRGSRFLLCAKSLEDRRYSKYPPQPLFQCDGYQETPLDRSGDAEESGESPETPRST